MTDERIALIRRCYEAFNRRDPAAVRDAMHPEFELDFSASRGPERGTYRGENGMARLWRRYWEAFDEITIEPDEFVDAGDHVVAIVRARGRGRGSGVEIDARGPHVWRFREGKVVGFRLYQEVGEALEAVARTEPLPDENAESPDRAQASGVRGAPAAGDLRQDRAGGTSSP